MSRWTVSSAFSGSYEIRKGKLTDSLQGGLMVLDQGAFTDREVVYLTDLFPGYTAVLQGGEEMKTWDVAMGLADRMEQIGLQRRDEVLAVGGGAVLDVVGFAASVYRRGVPFVRVPTTLLAYVDASVGVKTGINVGPRKNLIGSFTPPHRVILDRSLMKSLPPEEISSGLGEVIKLAVGCEPSLMPLLAAALPSGEWAASLRAEKLLDTSITVMLRELQPNLYEGDLCRAVDLGHTFSLPMEMAGMRHGEAVAVDVLLSCGISWARGLLSVDAVKGVRAMMTRLGLPLRPPGEWNYDVLLESLEERRRHRGGDQRVPLPARIGSCIFADDITEGDLRRAVSGIESR